MKSIILTWGTAYSESKLIKGEKDPQGKTILDFVTAHAAQNQHFGPTRPQMTDQSNVTLYFGCVKGLLEGKASTLQMFLSRFQHPPCNALIYYACKNGAAYIQHRGIFI